MRVPSNRPGKESAARIELRSPDPACNPYLALALICAAGLRGIEGGYELRPELDPGQLETQERLPADLGEALDAFEGSELRARGARRAALRLVRAQQAQRVARLPHRRHRPRAQRLPGAALGGHLERAPG